MICAIKKHFKKAPHATNSNLNATHTFKTNLKATRKESRTNLADLKMIHAIKTNTEAKTYCMKILKRSHILLKTNLRATHAMKTDLETAHAQKASSNGDRRQEDYLEGDKCRTN